MSIEQSGPWFRCERMPSATRLRPVRVVLVGTGTEIGKTHVACSLIAAWVRRSVDVVGLKPIETGVRPAGRRLVPTDQERLFRAAQPRGQSKATRQTEGAGRGSSRREVFHVKRAAAPQRALYAFVPPVSPHIAARELGLRFDLTAVDAWVNAHGAPVTVVETAGALFSPIDQAATNFDLLTSLRPDAVVLVAPDRLGVLHDVTTTVGLAAARGGPPMTVVLSSPEVGDSSTGLNAAELRGLRIAAPVAVFPRQPVEGLGSRAAADALVEWIERTLAGAIRS
jgi:dethiobiotin synthetase